MELSPLGLKLSEIECFRYRVDDVLHGVNKKTIMKARARELQHEILTNARLKSKLEQTDDLRALKRSSRQIKQSVAGRDSLRHLPAYLIPDQTLNGSNAVQAAVAEQAEERIRKRKADPLKSFTPKQKRRKAGDLSNSLRREPDHKTATVDKLPPLAGRKLWKMRHGKKVGKLMQRQGTHGNARSTSKRAKQSRKQGVAV
jgi:ATP-dependent RNA helicase DDX56/DBP9